MFFSTINGVHFIFIMFYLNNYKLKINLTVNPIWMGFGSLRDSAIKITAYVPPLAK